MLQTKRKPRRSEIKLTEEFTCLISQMTPEQLRAFKAIMIDVVKGRPTELSEAEFRRAVAS